jgi:hypothetical protein
MSQARAAVLEPLRARRFGRCLARHTRSSNVEDEGDGYEVVPACFSCQLAVDIRFEDPTTLVSDSTTKGEGRCCSEFEGQT